MPVSSATAAACDLRPTTLTASGGPPASTMAMAMLADGDAPRLSGCGAAEWWDISTGALPCRVQARASLDGAPYAADEPASVDELLHQATTAARRALLAERARRAAARPEARPFTPSRLALAEGLPMNCRTHSQVRQGDMCWGEGILRATCAS